MRTTQKDINELVNEVANAFGLSASRDEAIKLGQSYFLYCEFASVYGGYRLIGVNVDGGGHRSVFGHSSAENRVKAEVMAARLGGMLDAHASLIGKNNATSY